MDKQRLPLERFKGALAYMTFENGAAAEVWVEECKEGEHPEVIEQWKQQNDITDDRSEREEILLRSEGDEILKSAD